MHLSLPSFQKSNWICMEQEQHFNSPDGHEKSVCQLFVVSQHCRGLTVGKEKKKQQQQKNPKKITYFCFSVFAHICRWAVCTCSRGTESSPAHQHLPADGSQKHILCSCVCELTATDSQGYVTGSCCEQQYNNNNKHQYLFHLQLWLSCNLERKASCLSIII